MGAVKAGMGLQSWAQFGLGVVTDIASAGINIGASSLMEAGKATTSAVFKGVGNAMVSSVGLNGSGKLTFDYKQALTSGVAGSLGNVATAGMSNELTSSLVSGGFTSMGSMAYNKMTDGHWKVADTLRTGAITSLSTYMASKIVGGVINNDGNTAYSNQIATGMLGHGIATGSEWLMANKMGLMDKKDVRATDWNSLTEANAWQEATKDWRVKGDGSLPWETTADQERAGQQALPPNEQKSILERLMGTVDSIADDVKAFGGEVSSAFTKVVEFGQSTINYAHHGVFESANAYTARATALMKMREMIADVNSSFKTDSRAVTNEKMKSIEALANELGGMKHEKGVDVLGEAGSCITAIKEKQNAIDEQRSKSNTFASQRSTTYNDFMQKKVWGGGSSGGGGGLDSQQIDDLRNQREVLSQGGSSVPTWVEEGQAELGISFVSGTKFRDVSCVFSSSYLAMKAQGLDTAWKDSFKTAASENGSIDQKKLNTNVDKFANENGFDHTREVIGLSSDSGELNKKLIDSMTEKNVDAVTMRIVKNPNSPNEKGHTVTLCLEKTNLGMNIAVVDVGKGTNKTLSDTLDFWKAKKGYDNVKYIDIFTER